MLMTQEAAKNTLKELVVRLDSVEMAKALKLEKQNSKFYLILDMRDIKEISLSAPYLKATSKIFDFCNLEAEDKRLVAVIMVVKNEIVRKLMATVLSMHKTLCPSLICLDINEAREFANDQEYLMRKKV